jgi:hypothetical protein
MNEGGAKLGFNNFGIYNNNILHKEFEKRIENPTWTY